MASDTHLSEHTFQQALLDGDFTVYLFCIRSSFLVLGCDMSDNHRQRQKYLTQSLPTLLG